MLVSGARHFTDTVTLFTPKCQWILVNFQNNVTKYIGVRAVVCGGWVGGLTVDEYHPVPGEKLHGVSVSLAQLETN